MRIIGNDKKLRITQLIKLIKLIKIMCLII